MIHASVKSNRYALFAYRMKLLNTNPILLRGQLPTSLVPMDSSMVIVQQVAIEQATSFIRLSLAIHTTDLLSYYVSRLLDDALMVPGGLLLLLIKIPLVSKQTVFTLFEAHFVSVTYPQDRILSRLLHGAMKIQV